MKQSLIVVEQAELSANPANPASGYSVLFPKTDGHWYRKQAGGDVLRIDVVPAGGDTGDFLVKSTDNDWEVLWSNSLNANKIADGSVSNTEFQYLNGATSNIQTQINDVNLRYFNVRTYGALGNGSANDQPAIQDTIDAASAAGGGVVYFGDGEFKIDSQLVCTSRDVKFYGSAKTVIKSTFATGDILYIYPAVTPSNDGTQNQGIQGLEIKNLDFQTTVARSSGAAIHARYTEHAIIYNIRIGTMSTGDGSSLSTLDQYDGIFLEYQSACDVSQVQIYTHHDAFKVCGNLAGGFWAYFNYDGHLHGNWQIWGDRSVGSTAIHIGGGLGGFKIETGNCVWTETGVKVDKTLFNSTNRELFFGHFFVDSMDGYGYDIAENSVNVIKWDNNWIAGFGRGSAAAGGFPYGAAINVAPQASSSKFFVDGTYIYNGTGGGIQASGGIWEINGNQIYDVGFGSNGGDGISMLGNHESVNIAGNKIFDLGQPGFGAGIRINHTVGMIGAVGNQIYDCAEAKYVGPSDNDSDVLVRSNSGLFDKERRRICYPIDNFTASDSTNINGRPSSTCGVPLIRQSGPTPAQIGSIGIVSNAIKLTSSGSTYAVYAWDLNTRDVDMTCTMGTVGNDAYFKMAYVNDANNIQVNLKTLEVKQILNGVITDIYAGSGTTVSGNTVKVVLSGSDILLARNGVFLGGWTVSTSVRGTKHGIMFYNDTTSTISDVTFADLYGNAGICDVAPSVAVPTLDQVLTAGNTSSNRIILSGHNTSDSQFNVGTLYHQSYSLNNGWIGENIIYNGSFKRVSTGPAGLFYFQGEEGQFRFYSSGSAGSSVGTDYAQFKVNANGNAAIGGLMSPVNNTFTGATLIAYANGQVAIPGLSGNGTGLMGVNNDGVLSWVAGSGGDVGTLDEVLTAGNTSSQQLIISGASPSNSQVNIGTMYHQSAALNNSWIGENMIDGGGGLIRVAANPSTGIFFKGTEVQLKAFATGSAFSSVGTDNARLKIATNGDVALAGSIDPTNGGYTGARMILYGAGGIQTPAFISGYLKVDGSGNWLVDAGTGSGGMTNPMTTAGDLIVGGSSGTPARLGIGANNTYLKSNGSAASWSNFTTDVRAQFSAGTGISISSGVISTTNGGDGYTVVLSGITSGTTPLQLTGSMPISTGEGGLLEITVYAIDSGSGDTYTGKIIVPYLGVNSTTTHFGSPAEIIGPSGVNLGISAASWDFDDDSSGDVIVTSIGVSGRSIQWRAEIKKYSVYWSS